MRRIAPVLWLMWQDGALVLAAVLAPFGFFLVPFGNATADSIWMALPVFLGVAAFLMPATPYQAALPIRYSQIVLARILGVLAIVWLPLAAGLAGTLLWSRPWTNAGRVGEFAGLFTVTLLTAWAAYATRSRRRKSMAAILAAACGAAALWLLPWAGLGAAAAMVPIAIWILLPRREFTRRRALHPAWIWPLLRAAWSWRLSIQVPFAVLVGSSLGWVWVPLLTPSLRANGLHGPWVPQLPLSRRALLGALLIPVLAPFLAAVGHRTDRSDWRIQTAGVPERPPHEYCLTAWGFEDQEIRSPWGETALSPTEHVGGVIFAPQYIYNPYAAGAENSPRFVAWQFARETRDIYGTALTAATFPAAMRAGMKPLTQQPRMRILTVAFGAALLLAVTLLNMLRQWHGSPHVFRQAVPFRLVVFAILGSMTGSPAWWLGAVVQRWLLRLSALLPDDNFLMTAMVLAALAALYGALETVFNQVEIPDRKAQETL
jgi:hypothetical protein